MSKVSNSIGLKFERFLQERFPDLSDTGGSLLVPDFYYPSQGFWLEAKVGNILWGTRIKEYQIESFREIKAPVVYALGFHEFHNAHARLVHKTERGRQNYLDRHMEISQVCFITNDFMKLLWEKEQRTSKKRGLVYCMIKNSTLNNIFMNRKFKRHNQDVLPESYYGFSYDDYDLFETKEEDGMYWRGILDPTKDQDFIEFLISQDPPISAQH